MELYALSKSTIDNFIEQGLYTSHEDYLERHHLKVHSECSTMYEVERLDEQEQQSTFNCSKSIFGMTFTHRDTPSDKWKSNNQEVLDRIAPNGMIFLGATLDDYEDTPIVTSQSNRNRAIDNDDIDDFEYQNEIADTPSTLQFDEPSEYECCDDGDESYS